MTEVCCKPLSCVLAKKTLQSVPESLQRNRSLCECKAGLPGAPPRPQRDTCPFGAAACWGGGRVMTREGVRAPHTRSTPAPAVTAYRVLGRIMSTLGSRPEAHKHTTLFPIKNVEEINKKILRRLSRISNDNHFCIIRRHIVLHKSGRNFSIFF